MARWGEVVDNAAPENALEFETSTSGDISLPDDVETPSQSGRPMMFTVLVLIGALLAGLIWLDGRTEEQQALATPPTEQVRQAEEQPESRPAEAVAVLPEVLSVHLGEIEVFDDQLLGLLAQPGVQSAGGPPLVSSPDGQEWNEVPVSLSTAGEPAGSSYRWLNLETIGNELSILGFDASSEVVTFRSLDGAAWERVDRGQWTRADQQEVFSNEGPFLFFSATGAEFVGLRFFESGTVTCPGDSEATQLGPHFRVTGINRANGEVRVVAEEEFSLGSNYSLTAVELSGGRLADVYLGRLGDTGPGCGGRDVSLSQGESFAEFFIVDSIADTAERWTVPTSFQGDEEPLFLGEFVSNTLRRMLFTWRGELWTFQPDQGGIWTRIWDPRETLRFSDVASSYVLSDSQTRLYALADGQLLIWDFVDSGGFLDVVPSSISLEESEAPVSDFSFGRILYANDDFVVLNTPIQTWRVDLPVELGSCERQVARAERVPDVLQVRCQMR